MISTSPEMFKFTASSKGVQPFFFFFNKNGVFAFPTTSYFIDQLLPKVVNSETTEVKLYSLLTYLVCLIGFYPWSSN